MKIIGTGIDLVEFAQISALLLQNAIFETSVFSVAERAEIGGDNKPRLAAQRFAAKESVLKALGTGWTQEIAWTDVEILNRDSATLGIFLAGKAAEIAGSLGITNWTLGISYCRSYAIASTIAWRNNPHNCETAFPYA